ncbi:DNA adenine methylase [Moraxella sp. ZY210820]|uniref:DNA adenine methylase n=1 Tax=unclassified Moraxella TaxID=2685852 RepID=UPI0027315921|nr:DNA adenine methylase [Moraxella sp. ZY210820]WLF83788.1 DNA adenine methylase [Moraxella sp. ZY210820]
MPKVKNLVENRKIYNSAPLPFVGQKRNFLKHFRALINQHIPDDGENWTIVDVFGGSGLLAHNAKCLKPKATVIYNDYDGYTERLKNITDINRLRQIIYNILEPFPKDKRINDETKQSIINVIHNFDGYIDVRSVSTWLLFSSKQISSIDELSKHEMYNNIRLTDYKTADDYLHGLEITSQSFDKLLPQYYHQPNTLLLLDPPYICTQQQAYALSKYFGMVKFLTLMQMVRPPYIFFSSTRSELLDYLQYVEQYEPQTWQRTGGFDKINIQVTLNGSGANYEDNMIYRFK